MERVALLIERELDVVELVLTDPMTLRRLKAQRIARAAMAATREIDAEALRDEAQVWETMGGSLQANRFDRVADWLQQRANEVKEPSNG